MARLTAPLPEQIKEQREREEQLAWGAKHAPGPELELCDECARDLAEAFGMADGRKLCRQCVDIDKWLADARAYEGHMKGRG